MKLNKRILTLLVSGNILLTGCSINSNVVSQNENSSFDNNGNEIESDYNIDNSKKTKKQVKNNIASKKDNNSKINDDEKSNTSENVIRTIDSDLNIFYSVDTSNDIKEGYSYIEDNDTEQDIIYEIDDNIFIRAKETINVRYEPTTQSDILDILYEGNSLKKVGEIDNWYIVECNGLNAYVFKEYCEQIEDNKVFNDINEDYYGSNICYFPYGTTIYSDTELTTAIADIPSLESGIINYQSGNTYFVSSYGYEGYVC